MFKVNYTARVRRGGLTYNLSLTHYVTGVSSFNSAPRPFAFTNEYRELVAVMNVYLSFEAAEYFQVMIFYILATFRGIYNNFKTFLSFRFADLSHRY